MNRNKDRLQMYISLTKMTIVLCWLSLFSFWAIKLFGGNWFEIMVENENFLKFSNAIQNTWLKYLASFITIGIGNYLIIGGVCQKFLFKRNQLIIVIASIVSMWAVTNFVPISFLYFPFYYGYIVIIGYGIYYHKGIKRLMGVLAILLELLFSAISMATRNIPIDVLNNYFVAYIVSIDVYIMIGLYYLYSNLIKIQGENMIVLGHGWLGKEDAQAKGYSNFKRVMYNIKYALSFKWLKKSK